MGVRSRCLLIEALVCLALARLMLSLLPARYVIARLARPLRVTQCDGARRAATRQAVRTAVFNAWRLRWLGDTCYHRAIAAHWMLRRRRVLTQFHYGAANVDGRGLTGHIWLTDGNEPVVGGDSAHHYIKLLDWG